MGEVKQWAEARLRIEVRKMEHSHCVVTASKQTRIHEAKTELSG